MKKCEICNKEIDKGSPFNTERTHGQCVQNEFRELLNEELEKQRKSVAIKGGENMRTIFISDIHGNYTKFMALLKNVEYTEQDTLILGGDYFDRGKENVKMVEWLIENHNKDNIHLIRGNHDDFMIDLFNGNNEMYEFNYKNNGFNKTIKELIYPNRFYDPVRAGNLIRLRYPELPSIMNNLINYIEIDNVIYTHGSYTGEDSDKGWLEARWARSNIFAEENTFDKTIVIGHWIMGDEPIQIRNVIFCDGNFINGTGFAYIRNGKRVKND